MDRLTADKILTDFKSWSIENKIGFIAVGSLGYRNISEEISGFELCDDIDCVFIYNDITQLNKFPYLDREFSEAVRLSILSKNPICFQINFTFRAYKFQPIMCQVNI